MRSNRFIYYISGTCSPSEDTFTKEENMNANGGRRETSADTEAECRSYCLSKARDSCYGFDFNRANSQCWVHESESNFDDKNSNNNIDLFIRVPCGKSIFNFSNRRYLLGATIFGGSLESP